MGATSLFQLMLVFYSITKIIHKGSIISIMVKSSIGPTFLSHILTEGRVSTQDTPDLTMTTMVGIVITAHH